MVGRADSSVDTSATSSRGIALVIALPTPRLRTVRHVSDDDLAGLTDILCDCVDGGASVGFLAPLERSRARAFWEGVAAETVIGRRMLFVADDDDGPIGTVQLALATFENQPHRADLAKLLVHRRGRGHGVGPQLVRAAEAAAAEIGRTLLVLDTVPDSAADRLYRRLGWTPVGDIPGYALMPDGTPSATTVFYKQLASGASDEVSRRQDAARRPVRRPPARGGDAWEDGRWDA